jgi:ferredoxin
MTLKVVIDREGCIQCGRCYNEECPDVFEEDEDGTSMVKESFRGPDVSEGSVPDDMKDCVNAAAEACPVDVIAISSA